MLHARVKPAVSQVPAAPKEKKKEKPKLEEFIDQRDYLGAITLLEFEKRIGEERPDHLQWLAFSHYHRGDFKKAADTFLEILKTGTSEDNSINYTYYACALFFLGQHKEAEEALQKGPQNHPLQTRLLLHLAHRSYDEQKLLQFHQKLHDTLEDQLCLASIHYLRGHYQEAINVYKKILASKDYPALNVYISLCYYKLDYYEVSQDMVNAYLQQQPTSLIAMNLKACNHFRQYSGKAAEAEFKPLIEGDPKLGGKALVGERNSSSDKFQFGADLIRHNLVVFRNGENALQVLPPLLDVIPEARLNLVIHYLRNDDVNEAYALIKDIEPTVPQEYTLKAVVSAAYGQKMNSKEHLKLAQQYFQFVGSSPLECDTIPGRQCMASCFFLLKQFEDVLIYLSSIKSYFYQDDDFNWNYAIAKASNKEYQEAEEAFLHIQNEAYLQDYIYLSWLARCYIMNGKPGLAWELYLKMETSQDSFSLLQLIAHDCYRAGAFFYSAKAFGILERLDPNPDYWEGKRGACVGVFQQIVAGQESTESLGDIINMLRNTSNPQVEYIIKTMKKWAKENRVKC
eukprot:TRINITY_DN1954_c0_g2_i1.p1 TRINITY_DN1954_c0_g2~~TRINITY_DN1954_c0_g2_i1.p1  ORF type:complete len:569 (-),score=110.91 TRINITY_DN1954_c0_g2_i1:144-1850(-)